MKSTAENENDRVNEPEQDSIDAQAVTAPGVEQVRGAADEARAAAGNDEDKEDVPVEAAQE